MKKRPPVRRASRAGRYDRIAFAAGDRVVYVSLMGQHLAGTIVERPQPGGGRSIFAGVGLVHVVLDGVSMSIALPEILLRREIT